MPKTIKRFLILLLVLQLIIPYSVFAAAVGEFTSVVGEVTQTRAKEVIKPVVKAPIQLKDLIITGQASSAAIVFSDESTIVLSDNSKLEITEFVFKDKSRTGIFSLAMGKLTATVSKYIGGDNVFEVQSPTATVGVKGTGFEFVEAVNVKNENMATVSCTEGSLNLSALSPTGKVISTAVLEAGQMAVIIGGVITISAIAATAAAAGTGLSTGATPATATAAAGMSTTAIVGVAAGAIAIGAVAVSDSGGDDAPATGGGGGATGLNSCGTWNINYSSDCGGTPISGSCTVTWDSSSISAGCSETQISLPIEGCEDIPAGSDTYSDSYSTTTYNVSGNTITLHTDISDPSMTPPTCTLDMTWVKQ